MIPGNATPKARQWWNVATESVNQGHIENVIAKYFAQEDIIPNARKNASLYNEETKKYFEVDVWLPNLKLGFEFQDDYHYTSTWYSHKDLDSIGKQDSIKREKTREAGISLISIPCWWNLSDESFLATMLFYRPDLKRRVVGMPEKLHVDFAIPLNSSLELYLGGIPDVGELMLASFPPYNFVISSDNWWIGEKYDGIRGCWNPFSKILYARNGMEIWLHEAFSKLFPRIYVDCEVWFGKGTFAATQKLIKESEEIDWHFMRIVAFDKADPTTHDLPFEDRYWSLMQLLDVAHQCIILAARLEIHEQAKAVELMNTTTDNSGEGVVLRKQRSLYIPGRSLNLMKLKTYRGDEEAMVVNMDRKYILLQLASGQILKIEQAQSNVPRWRLKQGDIVSFSSDGYSRYGLPVNAVIFRIRADVSWQDVLHNHETKYQSSLFSEDFNFAEKHVKSYARLEKLIQKYNLVPIYHHFWRQKHVKEMLRKYRRNLTQAMQHLFPNILTDGTEIPRLYWHSAQNRRKFLSRFAKQAGLDPLVAENWFRFTAFDLSQSAKGKSLLSYYRGDMRKALVTTFSELRSELLRKPLIKWQQEGTKAMLERFAKENNFDPLVASNWYSCSKEKLLQLSHPALIELFGNIPNAILSSFPNFGLKKLKFTQLRVARGYFTKPESRRQFFIDFASKNKFDHAVPSNWYSVNSEDIALEKGGRAVMSYYGKRLSKALVGLFPDMKWDVSEFSVARNYWKDLDNRRNFFISFAQERDFDPLIAGNWYKIKWKEILSRPKAHFIKTHYRESIANAIGHLFPSIGYKKPHKSVK